MTLHFSTFKIRNNILQEFSTKNMVTSSDQLLNEIFWICIVHNDPKMVNTILYMEFIDNKI